MEDIKEKQRIYGKKSTVIKYNNNVIENEDTDLTFNSIIDNKTLQNVYIFILKYTINEIPYNVVLGKLQLNKGDGKLSEKAKIIQEYILNQLKLNNKGKNNYDFCNQLDRICVKNEIPFIYTDEGIQIVTNNKSGDIVMQRTYSCEEENNILKLNSLKPEIRMDLYLSEANIRKAINENIKQNKVTEAAEKELSPENMEKFNIGKKLKDFKNEESEDVIFSTRKALVNYLINEKLKKHNDENVSDKRKITIQEALQIKRYCKEKENRDVKIDPAMIIGEKPEITLEEKFFRLKEKAIAIDIKKILEKEQSEYLEEKMNNPIEVEKDDKFNRINNYKSIFDFIKQGMDVNAKFYYSYTNAGFEQLKDIIKKQKEKTNEQSNEEINEEELIQYLQLKEELLKGVELNKGKSFFDLYDQDEKVQKLIEFVMKTNTREDTKKDEKKLLAETYKVWIDDMILRHKDSVELYNGYARRFNAQICEIPSRSRMIIKDDIEKKDEGNR